MWKLINTSDEGGGSTCKSPVAEDQVVAFQRFRGVGGGVGGEKQEDQLPSYKKVMKEGGLHLRCWRRGPWSDTLKDPYDISMKCAWGGV